MPKCPQMAKISQTFMNVSLVSAIIFKEIENVIICLSKMQLEEIISIKKPKYSVDVK